MTLRTYSVLVEDTASEEFETFAVEASTPLIACTRTASRLFGPDAETRPVYGCAVCGAPLWEDEGLDSSGFRFCDDCDPGDLASREPQEPVALAVKTARLSALELARLPGDAPIGPLTVVVGDAGRGLERGDRFEDERGASAAVERALRPEVDLDLVLEDLTLRDAAGAYFQYRLRPVPTPVDGHDLVARGLISEDALEEGEEDGDGDGDGDGN